MSVLDSYIDKFLTEGVELREADVNVMLTDARHGSTLREARGIPDAHPVAIRIEEETAANIAKLIPESRIVREADIFRMIDLANREPDSTANREATASAVFNLLQAVSNAVYFAVEKDMGVDDRNALNVEVDLDVDMNEISPGGPGDTFSEENLTASYIQSILTKRFGVRE